MDRNKITTSESPKISLSVDGNLNLKGWDETEVVVKASSNEDLTIEEGDDEISIVCRGECSVRVPLRAQVEISQVGGSASCKSLEGSLTIERINGSLSLRSVGPVKIERVQGELTARNVSGDLQVTQVDGNITVRDVQGNFIVAEAIRGNLSLDDVDGSASALANGNVTLRLDPAPGDAYTFEAHGNLLCRLPADASVQVEITRAGGNITVRMPDVDAPSPLAAPYSLTLGDGDARLELSASGNITLSAQPPDWGIDDFDVDLGEDFEDMAETISQQVSQQIEAQMEMLEHQLESQLSNLSSLFGETGLSPDKQERIAQRAREASERANARAQEKIQRAQEKLQRKLEAARRRAEMKARAAERSARDRRRRPGPFEWGPPTPPHPPQPPATPSEPVSEEERMMILQMLEQQKISIEEAEQLLAALEGKG